jgi:hypothetical protein
MADVENRRLDVQWVTRTSEPRWVNVEKYMSPAPRWLIELNQYMEARRTFRLDTILEFPISIPAMEIEVGGFSNEDCVQIDKSIYLLPERNSTQSLLQLYLDTKDGADPMPFLMMSVLAAVLLRSGSRVGDLDELLDERLLPSFREVAKSENVDLDKHIGGCLEAFRTTAWKVFNTKAWQRKVVMEGVFDEY